ncbi:uncharacterized protein LOC135371612 [Ornithodoros turicata]|uniref:uncharacterized protein LOC135371612 n=1 Tax=Ornithodoros turicata TaxID=34597 RepID=UPI003138AD8D
MTTVTTNESKLVLHKLLERADLLSYYDKFIEIGGDNVQQLFDSTAEDFQEVIDRVDMARKPFHVKRLKKALGQWTGQSAAVASSAADESEGELHELLRRADLLSYHDTFIELGADSVQQLCDSTDEEFQTLAEHVGMARKPLHVKRLKNALKQWSCHAAVMTSIPSSESEREIHELLQRADLLAYYDKFIEKGVDNVQQLFDLTKEEFQELMDLVGMAGFPFHVMSFKKELEQYTGHPGTDPAAQFHLHMERSQQWKDVRKEMHEAIAAKDEAGVRKCLDAAPVLKLWLDPVKDKSALYKAVEEKALRIHGLLISRECALKDDEDSSCYEGLTHVERAEIRRQQYYTTKYEDSYIDSLKSKSRSASGCDDFGVRLEKTFKQLSSDEVNKSILKVVATAPHLDIVFDSVAENVQRITGSGGCSTRGLTYSKEQRVYVCGSTEKREVWGTLIHELSHMALSLVYTNEGKPYNSGDKEKERQYQEILNDVKGRKNNVHFLIQKAFDNNEEEELIVRIPHILTECDEGNRILELQAPKLLKFFKDTVMPDMQRYILNGIPSIDSTEIEKENARLGKASHVGQFKVNFEKPLDLSDLQNMPLLVLAGPELSLLEIMVHNTVQCTGQPYLFFEANQMDSTLQHVLLNYKCRLVLVTVYPNKNVPDIIALLSEVSRVTGTNVILVVKNSDKEYLSNLYKFFAGKHEVRSIVEADIQNVTRDSKEELFKNSSLSLQGEYVSKFPNVMHTDAFLRCLDTSVFLNLCQYKTIDLGLRLPELERSVKNCYVERVFTRTVQIDLNACRLDDDKNEAFALLGSPDYCAAKLVPCGYEAKHQENLTQFEKFVVLQESRDYDALLNNDKYREKVVHLLRLNESRNRLLWTKSNGRLSHLPMTGSDCYTEDALLKVPEKVVVVSGAPGMGKSVLASRLCTQLKTQDVKRWVLYVDLPQRMASVETASPSLKYLADLCQVQKYGLEFALFQESLDNGNPFKVVVMLDGFDEVNEECRECVVELVQFLAKRKIYKVYLFTRTVFKRHAQDILHTVSYDLVPFSDENQNDFRTRYRVQGETSATRNYAFAEKFQQLYATLKEKNKTILETPLLLRMMAQVESGEITKLNDYSSLLNIADISAGRSIYTVHIYKMFVEYKHLVHRKEMVKEDIVLCATRGEHDAAQSSFYANYSLLAMMCIFPEDALEILLNEDELVQLDPKGSFIKRVADNSHKEGFVNGINDGGTPEFVHKTFAEFFAAHYLLEKAKIRQKLSFRNKVLELYGKVDYEGVMLLFDGLASASYPLHSAVMNNDASYFEQPGVKRVDMFEVDELERTALHVGALHSDEATLKRLPMDDELIKDDLFQMSPFEYVGLFFPWDAEWNNYLSTVAIKKYLRTETSPVQERLDVLCARCSKEAVRRSTQNLRRCETFEQKRLFLERAIFTAVIHDLPGILDVYLSYVSPKESTVILDRDITNQLETRRERSLRCSAEPSVTGNLDAFADSDYRTAPFYAKSEAVCKMLLPYCDMGILDKDGNTMLHISAKEGNRETTQFHLAHLSVNKRNGHFQTPLHLAEDAEIAKLLLPLYPSVNVLDSYQRTPMDICVKRDYLETMKLLLLRTRTYDAHHMRLNTILHVASGSRSLKAVTFLLPHTNAHMLNYKGETCLDVAWAIWKYRFRLKSNVLRCLIPHSLVNSPETFGSSPLYVWAKDGGRVLMQTLWPYLRHSDPRHAQRISRGYVNVELNWDFQEEIYSLKLLFLHLDDIAGDPYSRKLLHDMAKRKLFWIQKVNYINYVKLLLPHLNLTEQDYVKYSARNNDIVTLYRRWSDMSNIDDPHIHDVNVEMVGDDGSMKLLIEAEEGNVEAVELHLSHSSVCFTDERENTALHLSAWKGHTNVVKFLIPLYTSVEVINVDRMTPMHMCASWGHLDVVKLLLLRSRMSSRDKLGKTPLHLACYSGAVDIVNFLLPHSFPNMHNKVGYTCCALSAKRRGMNVLRCLIPHSLMNCPNRRGQSPMRMCAKDYMREELVTLLPYSCDYDATSLLTILPLSFRKDDTSMEAMPCLKLMVLHSDVKAVDKCFCATLRRIRKYYVESDSFWRPQETEISLILNYIPLLLPHTNVSAKDDEDKKLLQEALRSSQDPEFLSFLQKWTRLRDFHS